MTHDPETGEVLEETRLGPMWNSDRPGASQLDPTPLAMPAGMKRPETLAEQVQRLVRTGISEMAAAQGYESFEESEDFDIDEDGDPGSPYETFFDPILGKDISPHEFKTNSEIYKQRFEKKGKNITRKQLFDALGIDPDEVKTGLSGVSPDPKPDQAEPGKGGGEADPS